MIGLRKVRQIGRRALVSDPINLKRPDHILEFDLPHPFQRIDKATLDLIEDLPRNTNAACSGQW